MSVERTLTIGHTWDGTVAEEAATTVSYELTSDGLHVSIAAPFHDDPRPSAAGGSLWELWEEEVVELFLVGPDGTYLELEFGPHGHYLALQLDGPRSVTRKECPLRYEAAIEGATWRGEAWVQRDLAPHTVARHNAFAIHGRGSERRYLAAGPLPGPKPDYHQPARFPAV